MQKNVKSIVKNKNINKNVKIKLLEEKLSQYNISNITNDNNYNNFDIKLKEPLHKLKYHTSYITCSTLLKDGRFVTGSYDNSIIIYNNKTFKPDLTIKNNVKKEFFEGLSKETKNTINNVAKEEGGEINLNEELNMYCFKKIEKPIEIKEEEPIKNSKRR